MNVELIQISQRMYVLVTKISLNYLFWLDCQSSTKAINSQKMLGGVGYGANLLSSQQ